MVYRLGLTSPKRRDSERWSLIKSGIDRKDLKIRGSTLQIKGIVHATVRNNTLEFQSSTGVGTEVTSPIAPVNDLYIPAAPTDAQPTLDPFVPTTTTPTPPSPLQTTD